MSAASIPAMSIHEHVESRVYLYPGGLWAEAAPGVITTVLGSCVSVCLWDPHAALGGINHFILPHGGSARSPRYGNHSLVMLLERVLSLGAHREQLLAAVFGGASVLALESADLPRLGGRNVAEALEFLQRAGIPIVRQDVGGRTGRKLTFRSADGTTLVRKL
ncbi:MAG: chemotaxis protein CheD [Acidobacteriota bacterium]|jgi:chemotaxis protein CheD|nr:chemotaxis protein CheD [Acidobacteriota bacterium]